jgi:hypothetical protein
MKYRVHCYVIVRVPIEVEANNHRDAMEKATDMDFNSLLNTSATEFADEIEYYLVDEENDPEFNKSQFYDKELRPMGL